MSKDRIPGLAYVKMKPMTMKAQLIHRILKGHMPDSEFMCSCDFPAFYLDPLWHHSGIPIDKIKGREVGVRTE